jgi:hypothetical protein
MKIFLIIASSLLISSCAYKIHERPSIDMAVYKTKLNSNGEGCIYRSMTNEFCCAKDPCFKDKIAVDQDKFDLLLKSFLNCWTEKE